MALRKYLHDYNHRLHSTDFHYPATTAYRRPWPFKQTTSNAVTAKVDTLTQLRLNSPRINDHSRHCFRLRNFFRTFRTTIVVSLVFLFFHTTSQNVPCHKHARGSTRAMVNILCAEETFFAYSLPKKNFKKNMQAKTTIL